MEVPPELEATAADRDEVAIGTREYDGETVIAVDFGPGADPSVDVVDGTAIVAVGGDQFEFDVPSAADEVVVSDGIVTIRE